MNNSSIFSSLSSINLYNNRSEILVLKEYSALHIGSDILHVLELKAKELNYQTVCLSAQVRTISFYQKNGYINFGEEYLDEYCPHVYMKKKIA